MKASRRLVAVGVGLIVAVTTTGCLQSPNEGGAAAAGLEGYVDNAQPDGDGKVTVLGAFCGDEQKAFVGSLTAFEEESGIDIEYTCDSDYTTTIKTKVDSGDAPDIGFFPQPGGLFQFAEEGAVQPIDTFLDYDALDASLVPGFLESARYKGRVYGAPMRMAVKSIVWYPKKAWDAAGHPKEFKSVQDLLKFSDELAAQGETPWCMGWESGPGTGWVGTDWVEEMVLRIGGPDVYDDWLFHEIPFNDDVVIEALDEVAKFSKDSEIVLGGNKGVLNTAFAESMLPAFQDPPKCWMERQGNFATGFYPPEIQENLDTEVGIFPFPPFEGGYDGQPILGGGDIAALFNGNDDEAKEVMRFLTSPDFGAEWAQAGGWLSPHKTFDGSNYPDEITRQVAEMAYSADVFRYDGSDVMPKEVGSGTFWTEMVKWENGASSQETADAIESSWPKSEE